MSGDRELTSTENYSSLDRLLHRLVFISPLVQLTAADIETSLYANRFRHIRVERPVFVTSLPRAGTTLMLEVLTGFPSLASHCYRDMPFVLAPLFWDTLSKNFRKPAVLKERAHGDGMTVSYDSAEAFEEILWQVFWPKKFRRDRIELWSEEEATDEFREFFVIHMQKIIASRSNGQADKTRYISKNNANIARIRLLKRLFPDGLILIPFRNPIAQATSLLRQHLRFLDIHNREPFSKRYMSDIGHLEFGELHRPIHFDGVDEILPRYRPDTLDYWIAYWLRAFGHIARLNEEVLFVSYERLCKEGSKGLREIAKRLGIHPGQLRDSAGSRFRAPHECNEGWGAADKDLLEQAQTLHADLLSMAIV